MFYRVTKADLGLTVPVYYFLQNKNAIDRDVMENIDRKVQKMFGVLEDKVPQPDLVGDENQEEIQAYKRLFKED